MIFNILTSVISFIVVISILVFFHELGHYLVARFFNVSVVRFSIGFGPKLFSITDKNNTEWQVSTIPLGGYVQMLGDMNATSAEKDDSLKHLSASERKYAFPAQELWKKMWIVAAGPIANFLLAIILLAGIFFFNRMPIIPPVIGEIADNSPAEEAGLKPGDEILEIEGKKVDEFTNIPAIISFEQTKKLRFLISRGGERLKFDIKPEKNLDKSGQNSQSNGKIGIMPDKNLVYYKNYSLSGAITKSVNDNYNLSVQTLRSLGEMVLGLRGAEDLGGPIKIAKYSKNSADNGVISLIYFIAVLSLNLGLINILPIPLLDGGHLMYYSLEAITGDKLSNNIKQVGYRIGAIIIFSLLIFSFYNDISSFL
jgi:regulator of sigma E protease